MIRPKPCRSGQLSEDHLERIRGHWRGTLVVKCILHRGDAVLAADNGLNGIIVSNHRGRQLDGAVAPMQVLPEIIETVVDRISDSMSSSRVLHAHSVSLDYQCRGRAEIGGARRLGEEVTRRSLRLEWRAAVWGVER